MGPVLRSDKGGAIKTFVVSPTSTVRTYYSDILVVSFGDDSALQIGINCLCCSQTFESLWFGG